MISIRHTSFSSVSSLLCSSEEERVNSKHMEGRAVAVLYVQEDGEEFGALVKSSLESLLEEFEFYALLCESFPEKKSRLRSFKGYAYGLRKRISEEDYYEEEFDLPEKESLFLAMVKIKKKTLSIFLDHLIDSNFAFGILIDSSSSQPSTIEPANLLSEFFHAAVRPGKVVEIDRPAGIELLTGDHVLAFDLDVDKQDRQYLEFFGPRELIHTAIHQFLIPRLKEGFRFTK